MAAAATHFTIASFSEPGLWAEEERSPRAEWPTNASDLQLGRQLGRGTFGDVYECEWPPRGETGAPGGRRLLAVKKMLTAKIRKLSHTEQIQREISFHRGLNHPHIVRFFFDFCDEDHIYIGMELAAGGNMYERLSSAPGRSFDEALAARCEFQCCDALEYLHGLQVIHRDIKPENILFGEDDAVKLADFGCTNVASEDRSTFCGTQDYLAPELIRMVPHDEKVDMWACGVLLYEMLFGKSPFRSSDPKATFTLVIKCEYDCPSEAAVGEDARDLIGRLLRLKPSKRLAAAEAKRHAFILRNYSGQPAEPVAEAEVSPEAPAQAEEAAEQTQSAEFINLLQSKSALEHKLLSTVHDLQEVHELLTNERQRCEALERDTARLREERNRYRLEAQDLAAEVARLKRGS